MAGGDRPRSDRRFRAQAMKTYEHILTATDFSELSRRATLRAADLAEHYGARLTLFHVIEHFPEDIPNDFVPPENRDPKAYLADRAKTRLTELSRLIGHVRSESKVKLSTRSAKSEILQFARYGGIDLVVLGTHGHRGLGDVLGSTAGGVVHAAPCDVLAVRGPE